MSDIYTPQYKTLVFPSGQQARALEVMPSVSVQDLSDWLNLPEFRFCVAVHGSAVAIPAEKEERVISFLQQSLIRFAEDNQALIGDGATDTGVTRLVGEAYHRAKATFPLVGVSVRHAIHYPDESRASENQWPLNPHHPYFVLVDAEQFGMESFMLVGMARARGSYGLALVIGGGGIVRSEVEMHARLGTPVIALKGTGRYADELAAASIYSELRKPFVENATTLKIFDLEQGSPEDLYRLMRSLLLR